jgi:hypothetical protein
MKSRMKPKPEGTFAIWNYWTALVPYNPAIQATFEESHKPDGWGGLGATPWYLALPAGLR